MNHVMKNLFMPYANNKGADQPAHPRSLISAFVVRCLDSTVSLVSISKTCKPLARFYGCTGRFVSYLVTHPDDRFSRDEAHNSFYQSRVNSSKHLSNNNNNNFISRGLHIWHECESNI